MIEDTEANTCWYPGSQGRFEGWSGGCCIGEEDCNVENKKC